jgi:predicted N-acetyltransferase YhbS
MAVVGRPQLVLDDQDRVVGEVLADQVQGEAADRVLGPGQLQVDAKRRG